MSPPARFSSPSFLVWLVLSVAIVFFRFVFPPVNILSWDVFGYYLYLPARFIYHDISLHDLSWVKAIVEKYHTSATLYQLYSVPGSGCVIKYSMGMALLNAPAFFIAQLLAGMMGYAADGFSLPYQYSFAISGLIYAIAGIFMLRKILLEYFEEFTTSIVLILMVAGTNYFQLTAFEGMLTHNYLFTLYTFIIWFTLKWHREPNAITAALLGIFMGLAILTRPSELVCLVIPLAWGIHNKATFLLKLKSVTSHCSHLLWLSLALFLAGLPQLIYWKLVTGHWVYYSYNNPGEGFDFTRPYILQVLFSFRKGWIIYTPIMIFALAGFYHLYRRNKPMFPVILSYFLLNFWVVSSWTCWWYAGGSYSQRALLSSYVLLALPLGYLIESARHKKLLFRISLSIVLSFLLLLNIFQIWQWANGIIDKTRMTRAYYCSIFGKTFATDADRSLLLIDRTAEEKIPRDVRNYSYRELAFHSYENPGENQNKVNSEIAFSGKSSLELNPASPFAAGVEIPYKELTRKDYAWIRVSCMVYILKQVEETQASLVACFEHNGEAYKYSAESVLNEEYHVKSRVWTKVSYDYLTPETRSPDDKLKVYFWLQGNAPVLIDDFRVEMWEPKE
jgi:hypothetical protein